MTSAQKVVLIIIGAAIIVISVLVGWRFYQSSENRSSNQNVNTTVKTNISTTNIPTTNFAVAGYVPGIDDDPALGPSDARVKIIAFEDFQCPYCELAKPILMKIVEEYPNDVQYVYRDFPLYTIHLQAKSAAKAANCANAQGAFWQYHEVLFANQAKFTIPNIYTQWATELGLDVDAFTTCLLNNEYEAEIQHDQDEGILAGVKSTPTYFVNGQMVQGVQSLQQWETIVNGLLEQ